jgi:iron complex outermembrane receptor protein
VDLDLLWLPLENWSVQAALGYLDARIDSGAGTTLNILQQAVSTAGERPYAPHWSGSLALGYTRPMSSRFVMQSELSWHYRSEFSGTLSSAVDKAMSTLNGYGLLDGTVTLGPVDGRWSVSLWGRNLLDKVYSPRKVYDSLGSYVDIMGQPRSVGLQARYHW